MTNMSSSLNVISNIITRDEEWVSSENVQRQGQSINKVKFPQTTRKAERHERKGNIVCEVGLSVYYFISIS